MAARLAFIAIVISALISAYFLGYFSDMDTVIIKSPSDQREYKSYTLNNGLRVLLISDPKTDKSAASLDVHIGSTSDPVEHPGLAHFLEHMLFLGTESYPKPGEYQKFISKHGGSNNAYTSPEHTNYYFDIDNDYLEPALDRFAPFFSTPLLDKAYVDREINAVHSEYHSRLQDDTRRNYYAMKQALNPEHPTSRFATGSLDTLKDPEGKSIRDVMVEFYKTHYSANIMTLAVLGNEPIETLQTWVDERFSQVPNHDAQPLMPTVPLFTDGSLPADMVVKPIKNQKQLRIYFPMPPIREYSKTKPTQYIGYFIGHEGKGSLLSLLKNKGWAEALGAGTHSDNPDSAMFSISISLTEQGLSHIDEMTQFVFEYIKLLKEKGLQENYYVEQAQLAQIQFQFQEPSSPASYVSRLSAQMHRYTAENTLVGPYLMEGFDKTVIENLLSYMRPDNMLRMLIKPNAETSKEEKWYSVPYDLTLIPEDTWSNWSNIQDVSPELGLPAVNPFIPENLALKADTRKDKISTPSAILEEEGITLWHLQDDYYAVPKTSLYLSIRTPKASESVNQSMKSQLFVDLVNDQLNEYSYPAYLAGLSYQLYRHGRGLSIRIDGYNDKQSTLLETLLNTINEFQAKESRFNIYKQELIRRLRNAKKEKPYTRSMDELSRLLISSSYSIDEQIEAATNVTFEEINEFTKHLLDETQLVMLVHGNTTKDEALALGQLTKEKIQSGRQIKDVERPTIAKINPGEFLTKPFDSQHNDSAVTLYIQGPDKALKTRAYYGLISQILSAPFYQQIRTEQQMGYIVFGTPYPILEVPGIAFIVQSPNYSESDITSAIHKFLDGYANTLEKMEDKEFEQQKEGLITKLLETPKNLSALSKRYWNDMDLVKPDFNNRQTIADFVKAITKEEMMAFYQEALLSDQVPKLQIITRKLSDNASDNTSDEVLHETSNNVSEAAQTEEITTEDQTTTEQQETEVEESEETAQTEGTESENTEANVENNSKKVIEDKASFLENRQFFPVD